MKGKNRKHVRRVTAHAVPQVVIQIPIAATGGISMQISNTITTQFPDPSLFAYLIIPGAVLFAIEVIWRHFDNS